MSFTIFLSIFILFNSVAQLSFYKHYTVNDGLPSSEIFDITQDTAMNIWLATNYGVCKFDGYSFITYTTQNGLAANSTINIYQGKNGKLWFLSYSGFLSYYENGEIYKYSLNDSIIEKGDIYFTKSIKVDTLDIIWFKSKKSHKICKISPDNKIEEIDTILNIQNNYNLLFNDICDKKNINRILDELNTDNSQKSNTDNYSLDFPSETEEEYYIINNKYYKILDDYKLHQVSKPQIIYNNLHFLCKTNLYKEKNGNIWIRKEYDGVYLYKENELDKRPVRFFKNLRVTRVLKDAEKNYWFSTEGDGLFLVPSFQFKVFDKKDGISNDNIISMDITCNNLYFATNDNKIYKCNIKGDKIISVKNFFNSVNNKTYGRDILCHSDSSIWIITSKFLKYNSSGQKILLNVIIRNKLYKAIETKDKSVLIATIMGFLKYKGSTIVYDSREDAFDKHIRAIYEDNNGVIWLGAMDGLYSFQNKKFKYYGNEDTIFKSRITEIKGLTNHLLVGTRVNGIIVKSPDSIFYINKNAGLSSNMIRTIFVDNDSIIWVGTNKGLSKINIINKNKFTYKIKNYTVWEGLPSNEINEIRRSGDYLWVATNKGLISFNPEKIEKSIMPPKVHFEGISVNDKRTSLKDTFQLKHDQNNITFHFKGISYKGPGDITYSIMLKGSDKTWIKTKNTSARYTGLQPGNYTFYVKACNTIENWNKTPIALSFTIKKHFTNKLWFIILISIIAAAIILGIVLFILRYQKRKEEVKRELLLSEQKALRSQMNPHFIFNSLNSIQYFILKKDDETTDLYLANFSSLMRKVLENSKHNTISLSEELETLKIYLELEKLRFENKFDYKINIDQAIDKDDIRIPPMLIQPYLENAIWHGLMLKKTKGLLKLNIEKNNNVSILFSIEDNGIGRKKAEKISKNKKHYKSTGMKNIEERITLINNIYKSNMKVKIIDLYNDEHEPIGTKVKLYIPLIFINY
ncbi:MAG: histidine kinase [Bacteroidales bacterium]|nr:histidine kinase [Bacteroidales bacterium]